MSGHRAFDELRTTDPERRARIEAGTKALREALRLAELRERQGMTQQEVATALAVSQANVSKIERQNEVYLSTLQRYVTALGGRLRISAVFGDDDIPLQLLSEAPGRARHSPEPGDA